MPSAMELSARYIAQHPEIQHCLAAGVINYSKLARKIAQEHSLQNVDAVLVAVRRLVPSLAKKKGISDFLKHAKKHITVEGKGAKIRLDIAINKNELQEAIDALN